MIQLGIMYQGEFSQRKGAELAVDLAARAGLGDVTEFRLNKHPDWVSGNLKKVLAEIAEGKHSKHIVRLRFATGLDLTLMEGNEPGWSIISDAIGDRPEFFELACALAEAAFSDSKHVPERIVVARNDEPNFVPVAPIAKSYVAVTTTDAEVAENYDDPSVFWRQWRVVKRADGQKLCLRATDKADILAWLGATYEGTLAMVRAAKPTKSEYGPMKKWPKKFRAFWELGSFDDECAGKPALRRAGYDAKTKTLEYTGTISKTDDENRHVMLKEIGVLANVVELKEDEEGNAIEHVRVVFPEEWMARQEKRPLLDLGIDVYFSGARGELVAVE